MNITVFAKKKTTKEGKPFFTYIARLEKKDGSGSITAAVKFPEDIVKPKPDECPMNIIVEKTDMNLSSKNHTDEESGEVFTSYTLWVKKYEKGEPYVDHSLDDFC